LDEVRQYGADSFGDADYLRLYGLKPATWYERGIRLLGRTAVECTRDVLADRIGRDVAMVLRSLPADTRFTVVDPFAGSCNTLYWILRHLPGSEGLAFELDPQVFELTRRNVTGLDQSIELRRGDFLAELDGHDLARGRTLVFFVAPPWGTALDEDTGLDLHRTEPPITSIIERIAGRHPDCKILFVTQVYEKVEPVSLAAVERLLVWTKLVVYDFNVSGRNHGILLGSFNWRPA
jgi:hypothetical protein